MKRLLCCEILLLMLISGGSCVEKTCIFDKNIIIPSETVCETPEPESPEQDDPEAVSSVTEEAVLTGTASAEEPEDTGAELPAAQFTDEQPETGRETVPAEGMEPVLSESDSPEEPGVREEEKTEPETEKEETDADRLPEEHPDPEKITGCDHCWECISYPEEGHFLAVLICDCGWSCSGDPSVLNDEWAAHSASYSAAESLLEHGGCRSADEWIVDREAYVEWYCSKCGERKEEN